jgi:hypothetical protein
MEGAGTTTTSDHVIVTCPTCGQSFDLGEPEAGSLAYFGLRPRHGQPARLPRLAEALGSAAQALYRSIMSRIEPRGRALQSRKSDSSTDDFLVS